MYYFAAGSIGRVRSPRDVCFQTPPANMTDVSVFPSFVSCLLLFHSSSLGLVRPREPGEAQLLFSCGVKFVSCCRWWLIVCVSVCVVYVLRVRSYRKMNVLLDGGVVNTGLVSVKVFLR